MLNNELVKSNDLKEIIESGVQLYVEMYHNDEIADTKEKVKVECIDTTTYIGGTLYGPVGFIKYKLRTASVMYKGVYFVNKFKLFYYKDDIKHYILERSFEPHIVHNKSVLSLDYELEFTK